MAVSGGGCDLSKQVEGTSHAAPAEATAPQAPAQQTAQRPPTVTPSAQPADETTRTARVAPDSRDTDSRDTGSRDTETQTREQLLASYLNRTLPTDGPRLYPKSRNVWVRGKPDSRTQWIGFLWFGSSVALRETQPVAGPGCKTWYAIEPRGYVCVDGKKATLDPDDPELKSVFPYSPDATRPNPHPFYGESIDAQRYHHPPSERNMRAREWDFRFQKKRIEQALAGGEVHESLLGVDLTVPDAEPPFIPSMPHGMQEGHKQLIARSAVAWTKEFRRDGRAMVLTDDLTWVPKDRLKIYERVEFEGIHLDEEIRLPVAMFRERDRPKYELRDGHFVKTQDVFERLSWVQLSDERRSDGDDEYVKTTDGDWLAVSDAVIPTPRTETPWGAPVFGKDETGKAPRGRHTWVQVSILGGWLLAFEGTRPVFATLMSPGKGGPPHGKIPTLETASTPTGWFKITGKFVTSTMIAPNELVHSAVPWAQNFSGPYALHGAYWHDDWGQLKSGGCINLSPKDAHFMFQFTEPRVPPGWHGVRWIPGEEGSTGLIVER